MLEIGSLVDGKYRILQKIGQGGMSIVYLARNERANKQWAIKEVRKDGVRNFEAVKQGLVAEIDMLKRFNHPHLPSIIDVIDGEDTFLIVMDYIEGNTLDKALSATGAQSQDNVIEWAKQLCDVLGYLHSRTPPIIYRDMKPSNVMLKPDGQIMLIDFGTAREFKNTSVSDTIPLGTIGYAAPEQYGGHGQTDARTDIYCLGTTLYHLVTGHNPAEPPYEMKPIRQINPMLSEGLEEIIIKCTQRDKELRYQSCAELYYDLLHYEEMDFATRRKNDIKWRTFIASSVLSVVMGASSAGFYIAKNSVQNSTYDSYIRAANESTDYDEKFDNYKKAVELDPGNSKAYLELLDAMTDDNVGDPYFTDEEYNDFKAKVLDVRAEGNGQRSNIDILKEEDIDGYAQLTFNLGYACYFETEDRENSNAASRAKTWYDYALDTHKLDSQDESSANMISTLIGKREGIRRQKKDGTQENDWKDYWGSINEIVDYSEDVSNLMQLQMYKFALVEISTNIRSFRESGVPVEEMKQMVEEAKSFCERMESRGMNDAEQAVYDQITTGDPSIIEWAEQRLQGRGAGAGDQQEGEVAE